MHANPLGPGPRLGMLALISLLIGLGAGVSPYRFQEIYQQHEPAVLRLRSETEHGPIFTSAFLVRRDGTMLTALRAVANVTRVQVVDGRGGTLEAELLGSDARLGVALLRAPSAGSLPTLDLGSAEKLRKNDWVVGIGHDDAGKTSARAGCVSQRWRDRRLDGARHLVIDAATSPGGPVLDLEGRVVAIALRPKGARRSVALAIDALRPLLLKLGRSNPESARPAGSDGQETPHEL